MIKNYHEFEDHVMGTDRMKGSLLGFAHFIALDECIPMMQERQDDIQDVIHCLCPDTPRLHDQLLHKEFPQAVRACMHACVCVYRCIDARV